MRTFFVTLILLASFFCQAGEVKNTRQVSIRAVEKETRDNAKRERTESVSHSVDIQLRGINEISGKLEVVTIIFAKKLPKGNTVEHKSTRKIELNDSQLATLQSQGQKLTHTREHQVRVKNKNNNRNRNRNNNNNRNQVRFKKVPASGEKANGWAVRVYQDGKLLGEAASATHFKLDP